MSKAEIRDRYLNAIIGDLVGPHGGATEVLEATPNDYYVTGVLWPSQPYKKQQEMQAAEDEDLGDNQAEEDSSDKAVSLSAVRRPSTCGMSFALKSDGVPKAAVRIEGARYQDVSGNAGKTLFERGPIDMQVVVEVEEGLNTLELSDSIKLHVRGRHAGGGIWHVTTVMENASEVAERTYPEYLQLCLFQTSLSATAGAGTKLVPRPIRRRSIDEDEAINDLLFRNQVEWAVGHVCSVAWETKDTDPPSVDEVATTWLPRVIVPAVSAGGSAVFAKVATRAKIEGAFNSAKLSKAPSKELKARLLLVAEAYGEWLEIQETTAQQLEPARRAVANKTLENAKQIKAALASAVSHIVDDPKALDAFQLAQQAMTKQFAWTDPDKSFEWRPFQIAFQLLSIPGIIESDGVPVDEVARKSFDLLWFPTGGGKTEAYLGLTAFVLFYRRLNAPVPDSGAGVAVLMRYTLRLLTIQQFERATRLILACEKIRDTDDTSDRIGEIPFSIGLWVGSDATPNSMKQLNSSPEDFKKAQALARCPCCGDNHLRWNNTETDVTVNCQSKTCEIGGRNLPIYTVDELVYTHHPSLVIGTVDKFAQIIRKEETKSLFGGSTYRPPSLIIQDELHLISGPLGSLSGIYEAAIDRICQHNGHGPKIVGSTATIRRASDQVRVLYDRNVRLFPPPVLDANDSCFAKVDVKKPGREYVGIASVGRSPKFLLQAVAAAALQSAAAEENVLNDNERDPYWTLIAYFNSIRELGGAVVMMYDDVPATMKTLAGIHGVEDRSDLNVLEMSSRMKSQDIAKNIKELSEAYPNQQYDIVAATNMISVGVDIGRLGLMLVNGQPKSVAEYIQASSRVGRGGVAGVVFALYNAARPRDRSHFETFQTWHQSLYAGVEPNSVTPWADRARDRALHAVIVALAQHVLGMKVEDITDPTKRHELLDLIQELKQRVPDSEQDEMWEESKRFVDDWERTRPKYYWNDWKATESLLVSSELVASAQAGQGYSLHAKATPNSMRNVEPATKFRMCSSLKPT